MAIQALPEKEIAKRLEAYPLWKREGGEIVRTFQFSGFKEAVAFVNQAAELAEKADHHPDILIQYNKVTLRLSTHDAGGISERDFAYVQAIQPFAPGKK